MVLIVLGLAAVGCRLPRWRGPTAVDLAASRRLSYQGMQAAQSGRWEQAEEAFLAAIKRCPHDPESKKRYADFLLAAGKPEAALAQLEAARRLAVDDAQLRVQLAELALQMGRIDLAEPSVEEALVLQPQLPKAWHLRGKICWLTGRTNLAVEAYYRALKLHAEDPEIQFELAQMLRQRGESHKALVVLQHLMAGHLQGSEPISLLIEQGLVYAELGRFQEALTTLQTACTRAPESSACLAALAQVQHRAGLSAEAVANAQKALRMDPHCHLARDVLSQLTPLLAELPRP